MPDLPLRRGGSPPTGPRTLEGFSSAFEAIDVASPTGGAWLEFARQNVGGDVGLPRPLMAPHVRRLALELARSSGVVARFARAEALALLRCSGYADLVDDVVRGIILAPDAQSYWDLLVALAERPTPRLLHWLGGLLADPSDYRARGASYAIQALLVRGGLDRESWSGLIGHVGTAWRGGAVTADRRAMLGQLWAALPAQLQSDALASCRPDPAARPAPTVWSRSRENQHYVLAESLARTVTRRSGHREEPLLARLVFEAMYDPRGVRMSSATSLLAFSPFAGELVRVLLEHRDGLPDATGRQQALRVAAFCHSGEAPESVERLLDSDDDLELQAALTMAGRGSRPLPRRAVERGLSGDELTVRRTLHCLGLTGDDRLDAIAVDEARESWIRDGARWWREQGPRVAT